MIPDKSQRDKWRTQAENTVMVSAVGEYTPEEFTILLDAVDELEGQVARLREALSLHHNMVLGGENSGSRPCCAPLVVSGLQRYITAAFDHHDEFLARFWPSEHIEALHECYMASERTKLVVMFDDGSFVTNCISTEEFISWAESVLDA